MEEILASIRRIISEDSRAGPAETAPAAVPAAAPKFDVRATDHAEDEPIPLTDRSDTSGSLAAGPADDDEPAPLDLIHPLPPAPDREPESPLLARRDESDGVLDLTNEVREMAPTPAAPVADRPDRPTFLSRETYRRETPESEPASPLPEPTTRVEPVPEPPQLAMRTLEPAFAPPPAEIHPPVPEPAGERLLSATTEAATVSALARLRQAAARQHEPVGPTPEQVTEMLRERVNALLDERFDPALRDMLQPAVAERLPDAIREEAGPLIQGRVEPALREEMVTALNRRLDPLLREQLGPALRERLEPALQDRLEPLLRERLGPALHERLEPALQDRLEPLLRERLDPLLREWFDRNLPAIVERIVEREIERLVGQPGGN